MPVYIDLPASSKAREFVQDKALGRIVPRDPLLYAKRCCPGVAIECVAWRWPDGATAGWEPGLGWHSFRPPAEPDRPPRTVAEAWRTYELAVACGMDEAAARAELDADLRRIALSANLSMERPANTVRHKKSREQRLAHAMLLVQRNPDWPDSKIAKKVGVHRSTLSRSELYQRAATEARKCDAPPRGVPTGTDDEGRVTFEPYFEPDSDPD